MCRYRMYDFFNPILKNDPMDRKILQQRTKQFHIDIIKLCEELPRNAVVLKLHYWLEIIKDLG